MRVDREKLAVCQLKQSSNEGFLSRNKLKHYLAVEIQ